MSKHPLGGKEARPGGRASLERRAGDCGGEAGVEPKQTKDMFHIPVLRDEMLAAMTPADGELYVDGTFGAGGYSRALLEAADCEVIGIDRDPLAARFARPLLAEYPGRFRLLQGCFGDVASLLAAEGVEKIHGLVLDVGVSSMQIDDAVRGFSFAKDGPLDMRMGGGAPGISEGKEARSRGLASLEHGDSHRLMQNQEILQGQQTMTAADLVNTTPEKELADLIYLYGEERASRRIARAICAARLESPITTTGQLAEIIRKAAGYKPDAGIDPATRSFQALRIVVNDELGELQRALASAESLLQPGGRLVVVSFHSLEDRIVKHFFQERAERPAGGSRHLPAQVAQRRGWFEPKPRKAVKPTEVEIRSNPRARSSRLRAGIYHPEHGA